MTRRRVRTLVVVFLLLLCGGAVVNVAVAWGCANWSRLGSSTEEPMQPRDFRFIAAADEKANGNALVSSGLGVRCRVVYLDDPVAFERTAEISNRLATEKGLLVNLMSPASWVEIHRAGWPMSSLSAIVWFHSMTYCGEHSTVWPQQRLMIEHGILRGNEVLVGQMPIAQRFLPFSVVRVLPLLPLWPGFAINTIFYAALLWMMFAFPFVMRRRRRIKRGLCPACAYPVGASPVCTECGAVLKI